MRYSSAFESVSSLLRETPDPFIIKLEFMLVEVWHHSLTIFIWIMYFLILEEGITMW